MTVTPGHQPELSSARNHEYREVKALGSSLSVVIISAIRDRLRLIPALHLGEGAGGEEGEGAGGDKGEGGGGDGYNDGDEVVRLLQ